MPARLGRAVLPYLPPLMQGPNSLTPLLDPTLTGWCRPPRHPNGQGLGKAASSRLCRLQRKCISDLRRTNFLVALAGPDTDGKTLESFESHQDFRVGWHGRIRCF